MRKIFFHAGDAEILVDAIVIRGDVAVTDGPVFAVAVAILGFEIEIGEAKGQAAPDVGLAAEAARANPRVVGAGERILALIDGDIFQVIGAADVALEVPGLFIAGAIGRAADSVLVESERVRVWRKLAPRGIVVGPLHGAEFLFDGELLAGFKEQHLHAVTGEDVAGHAAGGTGADDDGVVGFREIYFRFGHSVPLGDNPKLRFYWPDGQLGTKGH